MYSGVGLSSLGKGVEEVEWSALMILMLSPSALVVTRNAIARTDLRATSIPPYNSFGSAAGVGGVWQRASPPQTTPSRLKRAIPIAILAMPSGVRENIEGTPGF